MTPGVALLAPELEIRILHVDDDLASAKLTATMLEREDSRLRVIIKGSGAEGIAFLAEEQVDGIISDYDMPRMNGIEFLVQVREVYPDLPFILFTGKGSEDVASEAIAAGVSDYLRKGVGTSRYSLLANRMRNLVTKHRAETTLALRARQQRLVAELGQTALSDGPLEELFERAVVAVAEALGNEFVKVLEYRPEHGDLLLRAGVGWRDGLVGVEAVGSDDDSQAGHTLRSKQPIVVDDLRTETRFHGPPLLVEHGIVSGISVIIGSPTEPWGVLGTHTAAHRVFTDDDIAFIQNVANVLATAIVREHRTAELKQYETVIESLTDAVYILDEAGRFAHVNDAFVTLVGYDRDTVLGATIGLIKDEAEVAQDEHNTRTLRSASPRASLLFETVIRPSGGASLRCVTHLMLLPYRDDRFDGVAGVLRPVPTDAGAKADAETDVAADDETDVE